MSFALSTAPDGAVTIDVRVPARRKPWLALWATATFVSVAFLAAMFAAGLAVTLPDLVAADRPPRPEAWLVWIAAAGGFALLAPRVLGLGRVARWRLAGRESVEVRAGRLVASRRPASGRRDATLDVTGGAFVGVVGDADRFLVRAARWRSGRWFRGDDVPGLDVGSVRISTAGAAVRIGLSLSAAEAEALAAALARLPGFARDAELCGLTGRI